MVDKVVTDSYDVLNLKALRCFWAMGRFGSLARASIELGISEAAVSQRIKALERYLDAKLYESRGGRVRLTAAGESTLAMATRLFDELSSFRRELGAGEPTGTLTVAANDLLLKYVLSGLFADFTPKFPRMSLHLLGRSTRIAHDLVRLNEADFAVVPERRLRKGLRFLPWRSSASRVILARDHPLVQSGRTRLDDLLQDDVLARYPLIEPETDEPGHRRVEQALQQLGIRYDARVVVGTVDTVKQYVVAGWGLAVVPEICITESDHERLVTIAIPEKYRGETRFGVVLREDKHLTEPLRFLLSRFAVDL